MPKKQSEGVFFANSALNIQRHIVKNTLLQTAFSAICPLGWDHFKGSMIEARMKEKYIVNEDIVFGHHLNVGISCEISIFKTQISKRHCHLNGLRVETMNIR